MDFASRRRGGSFIWAVRFADEGSGREELIFVLSVLEDPNTGEPVCLLLTYVDDVLIAHEPEGVEIFEDSKCL